MPGNADGGKGGRADLLPSPTPTHPGTVPPILPPGYDKNRAAPRRCHPNVSVRAAERDHANRSAVVRTGHRRLAQRCLQFPVGGPEKGDAGFRSPPVALRRDWAAPAGRRQFSVPSASGLAP
jgi:hypothetical protein